MCFHYGLWDNAEPEVVEAHNARAAAEKVCGRPLAQGVDKQSTLYVKVWPVISNKRTAIRSTYGFCDRGVATL